MKTFEQFIENNIENIVCYRLNKIVGDGFLLYIIHIYTKDNKILEIKISENGGIDIDFASKLSFKKELTLEQILNSLNKEQIFNLVQACRTSFSRTISKDFLQELYKYDKITDLLDLDQIGLL